MPGPYAHLALISEMSRANLFPGLLQTLPCQHETDDSLLCYYMLGSVSPDFPNLAAPESGNATWADAMHFCSSGRIIVHGIEILKQMPDDYGKMRCLAWLLGYSAHAVADAVIHPVVQLKVGAYETNVLAHRLCELHQDFHIAPLFGLGEIGASPYLNGQLRECGHQGESPLLAPDIVHFWSALLGHCHPALFQHKPPDIHTWYRNALQLADIGDTENNHLFPLARLIISKTGLGYPSSGKADPEYVDALAVPGGDIMAYDDIFAKAVAYAIVGCHIIVDGVYNRGDKHASWFSDWNLDTGCDGNGRLAFW